METVDEVEVDAFGREFRLDIVQVREARQLTDPGVSEVEIGCCIHLKDECGKEDVESKAKHANESTTVLSLMGT